MVIETTDLTYIYMKDTPLAKKALDGVDIKIEEGEFVGIIGRTGCGKTTLIQHFNALLRPTSGKVLINGADMIKSEFNKLRSKVGLVFQYPEHQLFEETVFKDIAFGIKKSNFSPEEVSRRVEEALELVGLEKSLLNKSVFELSGGQKRRAAIAGVLIMQPEVLVLDEPAAGLDPKGRDSLYGILSDLHRNKKITVVLVSHSMDDVAMLCSRVVVMDDGRIITTGTTDDVFRQGDMLEKAGLDVPVITKLMRKLKKFYPSADEDIFRIEDAKREILRLYKEKKCLAE